MNRTKRSLAGILVLGLAMLVRTPVHAAPIVAQLGDGLRIDYSCGCIFIATQAAPSLHLPSAKVARAEAEKKARRAAAQRLRQALAALPRERLGCDQPGELTAVEQAAAQAPAQHTDWGADGSVRMVLAVPIAALTGRSQPSASAPDAGPRPAVVLVDPRARPVLFGSAATPKRCAEVQPAPPLFETLADAVQALPEAAKARVVSVGKQSVPAGAEVLAIITGTGTGTGATRATQGK